MAQTHCTGSIGSSGWVRGGGKKHEIYATAFDGHLFMTYFYRASGACPPPSPMRYWRDRDWDRNRDRERDWEWWVSILCHVLYTLHRDRDRKPLFLILPVPFSVPVSVPCSVNEPLDHTLFPSPFKIVCLRVSELFTRDTGKKTRDAFGEGLTYQKMNQMKGKLFLRHLITDEDFCIVLFCCPYRNIKNNEIPKCYCFSIVNAFKHFNFRCSTAVLNSKYCFWKEH